MNWTNSVTSAGGVINSNVDFDDHPTGSLQPNFYAVSDGVSFVNSPAFNTVTFGTGPGQSNHSGNIPGEGTHPASNYLLVNGAGQLRINFADAVIGAGFFTIDKWNGSTLTVTALNSLGQSMGAVAVTGQNLQPNRLLFIGVQTDDSTLISSLLLNFNFGGSDLIGIDNIVFANTAPVPEPTSLALCGLGALGMAFGAARRRRQTATVA